jgi:hypothetical protein
MSDSITFTLDTSALDRAITQYGEAAQRHVTEAARVTAARIVAEAKARLARQLGAYATGRTERGIRMEERTGGGFRVISDRPLEGDEDFTASLVPMFIEFGTRKHAGRSKSARYGHASPARPYLLVSAQLEENAFRQRIVDALNDAASETGLGD